MDTITATAATKRAAELQRQLVGLRATKQHNENGLAGERSTLRRATESRVKLVGELVGADEATTAWANAEIDRQDTTIRTTERRIQSYELALARIDGQITALSIELAEARDIVEQEKRALAFNALQAQIRKDRRTAEDALDAARTALFALNRTAVQGITECGLAGHSLVQSVIEEFQHQQFNPELLGWRDRGFEVFTNLRFQIYPMAKDVTKRS